METKRNPYLEDSTMAQRMYRFLPKASASEKARHAARNTGTAFGIRATTARGAWRIRRQRVGQTAAEEMFITSIGD
mgnify:CR=1 FL=1